MNTQEYNGYKNYATWRVMLEVFNDYELSESEKEMDTSELSEQLQEFLDEFLKLEGNMASTGDNSLVYGYAMAFLDDVDWHEIAENVKENNI